MCHDNEEWCKFWRGIDLSFQNWHEHFDEFWPKHLKVWKIFIWMCSFWAKDILFELKRYRGVIFHKTEEGYKIWRGINLSFKNWHKEFVKFWPEYSEVSKIFTLRVLFGQSMYCLSWKITEQLSFMKLKSDARFKEKLTCCLENVMRNFANFHQNTPKCQNWNFDNILLSKVDNVWASDLQWSFVSWQWRVTQKLMRNWLVVLKLTWTSQVFTRALEKSIFFLFSLAPCDQRTVWATKVQRSYLSWHWGVMQILKKDWPVL